MKKVIELDELHRSGNFEWFNANGEYVIQEINKCYNNDELIIILYLTIHEDRYCPKESLFGNKIKFLYQESVPKAYMPKNDGELCEFYKNFCRKYGFEIELSRQVIKDGREDMSGKGGYITCEWRNIITIKVPKTYFQKKIYEHKKNKMKYTNELLYNALKEDKKNFVKYILQQFDASKLKKGEIFIKVFNDGIRYSYINERIMYQKFELRDLKSFVDMYTLSLFLANTINDILIEKSPFLIEIANEEELFRRFSAGENIISIWIKPTINKNYNKTDFIDDVSNRENWY